MRYIVYGAGAVGGTIGARLHESGHEVVFAARGRHLEALKTDGLTFRTPDGTAKLSVDAIGHASEIDFRPDDVVVLTVKSQDTVGALEAIRESGGSQVPIFCAQNGVANERIAARRFANVYCTVVMLPASHLEPGVIQSESAPISGILDTGLYPLDSDDLCTQVCRDFEESRFSARPDKRIMRQKYRKLLMNLNNAVGAICVPGEGAKRLSEIITKEAETVYEAASIDCMSAEDFKARRGDLIRAHRLPGSSRLGSSSWQSLARGTGSIETDYLNGEITLLGRLHSVPTPANSLVQDEANRSAREGLPPESIEADELLAKI